MRLFLFKILFFFLLSSFFPLYLLLEFVPKYIISYEQKDWRNKVNFSKEHVQKYKNFIIGDSKSEFLMYRKLKAHNLYLGATSPIEGYYIFKNLIQSKKIRTVYFSYSPYHLNTPENSYFTRTKPYNLFSKNTYKAIEHNFKRFEDKNAYYIITDHTERDFFSLTILYQFYRIKETALSLIYFLFFSKQKETRTQRTYAKYSHEVKYQRNWSKTIQYYLKQISGLCKKNNIRCIFVQMPLLKNLIYPEQNYFDEYYSILEKSGFEILPRKLLFLDKKFFSDSTHLNKKGSEYFYNNYMKEHH